CGMLICGERGSGREMIARAIHQHGTNRNAPFIKMDCSGPTPEDIELQLFGMLNKKSAAGGSPERRSLERIGSRSRPADAAGGNALELRTLLERLILLTPGGLIRLEDVLAHTQLEGSVSPNGLDATLRQARARFERDYIAAVLQHHRGRIADAAKVLGIQRTNLYRKMRRLNLMRT